MIGMEGEIYHRLQKGRRLDRLGLEVVDGRMVIKGLRAQQPSPQSVFSLKGRDYVITQADQLFKRVDWTALRFVDCDFSEIGFFEAKMSDCIFEKCKFKKAGFWDSHLERSRFIACDLRHCAFGGADFKKPHPNRFEVVAFERCDLRASAHSCEVFSGCAIDNCNVNALDFLGAVFEDCTFTGKFTEVTFRRGISLYSSMPENKLLRCDFTKADITWCQFLNIDIDPSSFAQDDDLIILWHGPEDWRAWLEEGHIPATEGAVRYIQDLRDNSGTPAICSRAALSTIFKPEEVRALVDIANRGRIGPIYTRNLPRRA
jgi:uncharacterized protein YjbI with pentapeptide repeats